MQLVTGEELEQMKLHGEKLLVDFFADWCGPCRMLGPRLERLESQYPDVKFVKVNVDSSQEYSADMGIRSVPTIMFFEGPSKIGTSTGVQPDTYYKEIIENMLS